MKREYVKSLSHIRLKMALAFAHNEKQIYENSVAIISEEICR